MVGERKVDGEEVTSFVDIALEEVPDENGVEVTVDGVLVGVVVEVDVVVAVWAEVVEEVVVIVVA